MNLPCLLGLRPSGLGNYFLCKIFAVQSLLWSLEFVIQIDEPTNKLIAGMFDSRN